MPTRWWRSEVIRYRNTMDMGVPPNCSGCDRSNGYIMSARQDLQIVVPIWVQSISSAR